MSIAVELDELRARIEEFSTDVYLLTVSDDGRSHSVAVPVRWDGDELVMSGGRTSVANAGGAIVGGTALAAERARAVQPDRRRRRHGRRRGRGAPPPDPRPCCTGPRRRARAATARRSSNRGDRAHLVPEAAPRLERFGQLVVVSESCPSPTPGAVRRPLERVDHVPAQELPPVEAPVAVDADVGVPVLEHALVPAAGGPAELVVAVHDAAGVVGVVEVDDVVADEVHRHLRLAQRLHEPRAAARRARLVAADAHVGSEQRDHHVHVARVERQRVAHRRAAGSRRATRAGRAVRPQLVGSQGPRRDMPGTLPPD